MLLMTDMGALSRVDETYIGGVLRGEGKGPHADEIANSYRLRAIVMGNSAQTEQGNRNCAEGKPLRATVREFRATQSLNRSWDYLLNTELEDG